MLFSLMNDLVSKYLWFLSNYIVSWNNNIQAFCLVTFNSLFIWGDGSTLDAHTVFFDGVSGVNGDLVIGGIPVRQSQIIVKTIYF